MRHRRSDLATFDGTAFLGDHGFQAVPTLGFFNHHRAHALPTLFHTDWPEALLYTADGGGDNMQYSIRRFGEGAIDTLYGGDDGLRSPRGSTAWAWPTASPPRRWASASTAMRAS